MRNKVIVLICFLNSAAVFTDTNFLTDTRENWTVQVAEFKTKSESPDAIFFTETLPAYLYNELSICKTHDLSQREIELMRRSIVQHEINMLTDSLSRELNKQDLHYLTGAGNIRDIKKTITDINRKIKTLERHDLNKIRIKQQKNIFYRNSELKEGVPSFNRLNMERYAEKESIDYLIFGDFDIFDNLIFIEIFLYSRIEKSILYSKKIISEIDTVFSMLSDPVDELTTYLLGGAWGKLDVITQNSNADIYINNVFRGNRDIKNIILKPGLHTVTVDGQGIERKKIEIDLSEREHKILDLDAQYREERLIAINTYPQDADIYFDSVWSGKSPSIINGLTGEVFIKKEGYRDTRIFLDDYSGNILKLELSPDLFRKEDFLLKKRNIFYRNLSYFIISVPVPLFMFALVNDYNAAFVRANESGTNLNEIERLREKRSYLYYGYYSSLFISISLFANMIFHLGDYIKAGDVFERGDKS